MKIADTRAYASAMVVVMVVLLIASCTPIPQYPGVLPPLTPADDGLRSPCPAVAGTYRDKGAAVSPEGKALGVVSLSQLLHTKEPALAARITDADVIVVVGPQDDVIEIQSWRGAVQIATLKQPRVGTPGARGRSYADTYICAWGFLRLGRDFGKAGGIVGISEYSDFLRLRRATDGSLIAYHRAGDSGLFLFLIPVQIEDTKAWYHFPPAEEPTALPPGGVDSGASSPKKDVRR